jgi:hypothetical protein
MKKEILKEYQELISDEHHLVKERALVNLLNLLDFLDSGNLILIIIETKLSFVIPTFKKQCDVSESLFQIALRQFGSFIWHTKGMFRSFKLQIVLQSQI